jgi:hypothetical protein
MLFRPAANSRAGDVGWLDPSVPVRSVLKPLPGGTLKVEHAG